MSTLKRLVWLDRCGLATGEHVSQYVSRPTSRCPSVKSVEISCAAGTRWRLGVATRRRANYGLAYSWSDWLCDTWGTIPSEWQWDRFRLCHILKIVIKRFKEASLLIELSLLSNEAKSLHEEHSAPDHSSLTTHLKFKQKRIKHRINLEIFRYAVQTSDGQIRRQRNSIITSHDVWSSSEVTDRCSTSTLESCKWVYQWLRKTIPLKSADWSTTIGNKQSVRQSASKIETNSLSVDIIDEASLD